MKQWKSIWSVVIVLVASVSLSSCLDDDDNDSGMTNYPSALVTLKTNPNGGAFYMQLDDSTTLVPTNIKNSPYGTKEVRALVNYQLTAASERSEHYSKSVYVNWIDTIRTKNMAPVLGEQEETVYGTSPLEIVKDWTTVVEDGYLTLRFRTYFGGMKSHTLNLVKTDKPYEVTLYHNANGDTNNGTVSDGIIAFRLNDLPDTEGKTVDLTVKWKSFSGDKTAKFKYCTRK